MADRATPPLRLAEFVAVLATATDLGLGLPMEHPVRACLLSVEMASFAADQPPDRRQELLDKLFTYTPDMRQAAVTGDRQVAQMLATRLGCPAGVVNGLSYVFERWDGTGALNVIAGESQPLGVLVMCLCNEIEIHHRLSGGDAAVAMARKRTGGAFDPDLVATFCADPSGILSIISGPSLHADLLAAEPAPHRALDEVALIEAAEVMADFTDQVELPGGPFEERRRTGGQCGRTAAAGCIRRP